MIPPIALADPSTMPAVACFVAWMRDVALPTWAERGFDPVHGRFEEALDFAGAPLARSHRAMVQARQIYVFAHADVLGWLPHGGELAERGMASLLRDHAVERGDTLAIAFSVARGGQVHSPVLDSYTHSFVLLALAELHRLTCNPVLLDIAARIDRFVAAALTDPVHGGLFDSDAALPGKRQNPVMHLVEAYLALEATAPGTGYLPRATSLIELIDRRIARDGVLLESFATDWSGNAATGAHWEPGHHYEWAWLLRERARLARAADPPRAAHLADLAGQHGHAPDGLIFDALAHDMRVSAPAHRLWPHSEALRTALVGYRGNQPDAPAFAEAMASLLMTRFLDRPFAGGWIDRIDAKGKLTLDHVPASSLYHLMTAASHAAEHLALSGKADE